MFASALARCFEEFIAVLAGHGHTTVKEIQEMFSVCILCREMATVAAVGSDRDACSVNRNQKDWNFALWMVRARFRFARRKGKNRGFRLSSPWVC